MTNNVWFITGAGRGMGLDITKAALAADHKVVANECHSRLPSNHAQAAFRTLPRRFIAGADAIGTAEQKVALLQQEIKAYRELSTSLGYDDA
jgi:NAD(P)-dependent dehydrogenase (short-subunit alcohol dehydrogenase family)